MLAGLVCADASSGVDCFHDGGTVAAFTTAMPGLHPLVVKANVRVFLPMFIGALQGI